MRSILARLGPVHSWWKANALLIFLGCLVGVVTVGGCGPPQVDNKAPAPTAPLTVQTASPHRGEIARTITLPTFRILPLQEATLYAKVTGYLKTLAVDKGDEVSQGQLLAEIEVPELLAEEA